MSLITALTAYGFTDFLTGFLQALCGINRSSSYAILAGKNLNLSNDLIIGNDSIAAAGKLHAVYPKLR